MTSNQINIDMENRDYKTIQISQLERDIKIIQDILDGKIENYTQHPLPILRECLADYQNKLNKLQQEKHCREGGIIGGILPAYAYVHV